MENEKIENEKIEKVYYYNGTPSQTLRYLRNKKLFEQ